MGAITRTAVILTWLVIAMTLLAGAGPRANGARRGGARANAELLQSLPAPVRRTIQIELANGVFDDVTRTNGDDGEVIYDVDFTRAGKPRNLTVALDGRLLDMLVYLPETPAPVREALNSLGGGAELGDITKNFGLNEDATYDADIMRDGTTRTYTVDEAGVLVQMQVFPAEAPLPVQNAIKTATGTGVIGDITKYIDEDGVTYEVSLARDGKNRTFAVNTNGELVERQVFQDEIPDGVQKAIETQAARGRLGKINQFTDEGKDYYEVEVHVGANTLRVTFTADGKLDSEDEEMALATIPSLVKTALRPLETLTEVITDITRTSEGTNTTYDIELRDGKSRRTITFDAEGKTVSP